MEKTLREKFKIEHPETVGETDKEFDDCNYIEWLEKRADKLEQLAICQSMALSKGRFMPGKKAIVLDRITELKAELGI